MECSNPRELVSPSMCALSTETVVKNSHKNVVIMKCIPLHHRVDKAGFFNLIGMRNFLQEQPLYNS